MSWIFRLFKNGFYYSVCIWSIPILKSLLFDGVCFIFLCIFNTGLNKSTISISTAHGPPVQTLSKPVTMETVVTSVLWWRLHKWCPLVLRLVKDVGHRVVEKQSTCTPHQGGTAQWKPFCNKPPVKQQVYYEWVWAPACWRRGRWHWLGAERWEMRTGVGGWGGLGGCCPGIACNKFYSLFKGGRWVLKRALVLSSQVGCDWIFIWHLKRGKILMFLFFILYNIWSLNSSQIDSLVVTWHCKAILTQL